MPISVVLFQIWYDQTIETFQTLVLDDICMSLVSTYSVALLAHLHTWRCHAGWQISSITASNLSCFRTTVPCVVCMLWLSTVYVWHFRASVWQHDMFKSSSHLLMLLNSRSTAGLRHVDIIDTDYQDICRYRDNVFRARKEVKKV